MLCISTTIWQINFNGLRGLKEKLFSIRILPIYKKNTDPRKQVYSDKKRLIIDVTVPFG